jgi:DNA-binding NarL/FixJ family response regulator
VLSDGEIEALRHIAQGLGNRQIATRLGVTAETVKTHVKHIFEKLDASDRTRAVAVARGIIEL